MLTQKLLTAGVAIAITLTGIVTEIKWLTVVGLVVWVAGMLFFGRGNRKEQS